MTKRGGAMKQNCDRIIFFACIFLLAFMFPPPPAQAGQTVIINSDLSTGVYGNGPGPNGSGTLTNTSDNLLNPNGNSIIVNGGTISGWVSGGTSRPVLPGYGPVSVTGNSVTVNSGKILDQEVFGGYGTAMNQNRNPGSTVTVANNSVIIQGDAEIGDVFGGHGSTGNHVNNNAYYPSFYGAASISVTGNSVTIRGDAHVYEGRSTWLWMDGPAGGAAYVYGDGHGTVSGNSVLIEGNAEVHTTIYGGGAQVSQRGVGTFSVTGNSVTITGGRVLTGTGGSDNPHVFGGVAVIESAFNGSRGDGSVTNNRVTISGSTTEIQESIYGGYVLFWDGTIRGRASVTQNTVTISGNPNINKSTLYGGFVGFGYDAPFAPVPDNLRMDAFTGNTLNAHTLGRNIEGIHNFNYLNFFLPETVVSGDRVFIASGKVDLSGVVNENIVLSTVNVGVDGRRAPLNAGDHVVLIDTTSGGANLVRDSVNDKSLGMHGVTLQYDFDIWRGDTALGTTRALGENDVIGHQLVASLSRAPRAAPGSDAISKGSLIDASMLLNQGADLAAEQGMTQALCAARCLRGVNVFTALSGGMARYDAGSHVDMFSASVLTGIAKGMTAANNCLTLGAFFEYGYGSYDADKPASSLPSAGGGGSNYSLGGGLLGRMQFAGADSGQFYAEASLRAGTIQGSHNTGLRDMIGREATYDSSTGYYGAHLGAGRVWRGGFGGACVDLGAKYFWTRRNSDSATLSTGETVDFRSLDSHRARVAARFSRETDKEYSPYVGVAYEYEFAAKARSRVAGYDLNPSSLRGGTAIVEAGLAIKPSANLPLSADLRAHGYLGKRTGMGASVRVGIEF